MRIRNLIVAAFAAALAGTLFAVPAFADDPEPEIDVTVSYPNVTVSMTENVDGVSYSFIRQSDHEILLIVLGTEYPLGVSNTWHIYTDSWIDTNIPSGTPFLLDTDVSTRARVGIRGTVDGVSTWARVTFNVIDLGDTNDTNGVFGSVGQFLLTGLSWIGSWLDVIAENPILLFFCLALPILTIGITIIRRVLAVRA